MVSSPLAILLYCKVLLNRTSWPLLRKRVCGPGLHKTNGSEIYVWKTLVKAARLAPSVKRKQRLILVGSFGQSRSPLIILDVVAVDRSSLTTFYVHFRCSVGKLQRNEYIRLNSSRATLTDTAHEDDYSVFSAYLLQSWTKGHVLLMDATPYVEWSMGAAFTVKYDTLPSYSAAREQLLSKEEGDRATDRQISGTDFGNGTLITIDYTVVLRKYKHVLHTR